MGTPTENEQAHGDRAAVPPGRHPALWDLAERYWRLTLAASPSSATLLGVHEWDDRLEDVSEEAEHDLRDRLDHLRVDVAALAPGDLSPRDRVTRALLTHQLDTTIEAIDLRLAELGSDHMDGPHAMLLMVAPQLTYPEPEHAEAALRRYEQVPGLLDQALDRFRAGLAKGHAPASAGNWRARSARSTPTSRDRSSGTRSCSRGSPRRGRPATPRPRLGGPVPSSSCGTASGRPSRPTATPCATSSDRRPGTTRTPGGATCPTATSCTRR